MNISKSKLIFALSLVLVLIVSIFGLFNPEPQGLSYGTLPTPQTLVTVSGNLTNKIPYGSSATGITPLSAGSAGQVLTSNATATPYWSTVSPGIFGGSVTVGSVPYASANNTFANGPTWVSGNGTLSATHFAGDGSALTGISGNFSAPTGGTADIVVSANNTSAANKARSNYVCDGVDDDVQIQAAITAANGGTVEFYGNLFNVSGNITVGNGVDGGAYSSVMGTRLLGHGSGAFAGETAATTNVTTFKRTGSNSAPIIQVKGAIASVDIENLLLDGSGVVNVDLDLMHPFRSTFKNLVLVQYLQWGFKLYSTTTYQTGISTGAGLNQFLNVTCANPAATTANGAFFGGNSANNVACSRNIWIGGDIIRGMNSGAKSLDLGFTDNNSFMELMPDNSDYSGNSGYAIYFEPDANPVFPSQNAFYNCAPIKTIGGTQGTQGNTFLPLSTGDGATWPSGPAFGLTDTGKGYFSNIQDSGLTSTRVPFSTSNGLLTDNSALTYTSGNGTLSATHFAGDGSAITGLSGNVTWSGTTFPVSPSTGQLFSHTPTGRSILYSYVGSVWQPIRSLGAMTMFVSTTGTNDLLHGTGTGTNAFLTIQYAIDVIPPIFGGNITITVGTGTFAESPIIRGKRASGNFTITINGTLTAGDALTASGNGTQGATSTQASFVDNVPLTPNAYQFKLLKFTSGSNNGLYRPIETNSTTTISLSGRSLAAQPVTNDTATVYDWGTVISGNMECHGVAGLIVDNMQINGTTGSAFWNTDQGNVSFDYDKFTFTTGRGIQNSNKSIAQINYCTIQTATSAGNYGIMTDSNSTSALIGCLVAGITAQLTAIYTVELSFCYLSGGNIINTGVFGLYASTGGYVDCWGPNVYNFIKNCSTYGSDVDAGSHLSSHSYISYSGNGTNEYVNSAAFAYIQ